MNNGRGNSSSTAMVDPTPEAVESFLGHVLDLVKKSGLVSGRLDESTKVVEFEHPKNLEKLMPLDIGKGPADRKELEDACEKLVKYSVHTTHPHFYNQLYHGVDGYGLAGAWLTEALNTNSHTFEVAPVFIIAERAVIRFACEKFGYDPETSDGIFAPGGSFSNMYAMMLARQRAFPEVKSKGLRSASSLKGDPVLFTADESHYSVAKGANWMGLGTESVVKVKTDFRGRMTAEALEAAIVKSKSEGKCPFFVNSTSGSTVMGAYDEIDKLAEVCKKHDVWLHVDACWGGAAVLSPKYKYLLRGSEKADSLAWNAHKMLCAPLQSSLFLTKHRGMLHHTNCASATYLFQQDKFYDVSYDTGDKSVQCGRKAESFKVWFMLKARGEDYLEAAVDNCFEAAKHLHHLINTTPGFRPAFADFGFDDGKNCTNVCFEYIPPSIRHISDETDPAFRQKLNSAAPDIKERMILDGTLMIGYQPLPHKGKDNFFRVVIGSSPPPTKRDMEYLVAEIERCGKDL